MRRTQAEGGTSAFSWVADSSSRLVVTATTSRWIPRNPSVASSVKGQCVELGAGGTAPFFAVCKRHPRHPWLPQEGGAAGNPSDFDASSPCCWRHSLPPFFIACGRPNQERSSLPPLTVLPLLTGEHQEEGEWVEKTRVQTSGSGRHPGVFFWGPRRSCEMCGWMCGWKIRSIWERGPERFQNFLLDLIPAVTLSVLNSS